MPNKCCTKARAEALGCKVINNVDENKLVEKEELTSELYQYKIRFRLTINTVDTKLYFTDKNHPPEGYINLFYKSGYPYKKWDFPKSGWSVTLNYSSILLDTMDGPIVYTPTIFNFEMNCEVVITNPYTNAPESVKDTWYIDEIWGKGVKDVNIDTQRATFIISTSTITEWINDGCDFTINITYEGSSSSSSSSSSEISLMNTAGTTDKVYVIRPILTQENGKIQFKMNMHDCPSNTEFGFVIDIIDGECVPGDFDTKEPTRTYQKYWNIQKDGVKDVLTLSDFDIEQGETNAIRIQPYIINPIGTNCIQFASHIYELYLDKINDED